MSMGSLVVAITLTLLVHPACTQPGQRPDDGGHLRTVIRVVDGDTLVFDGGERVRLIGVDTPKTIHPNKPVERFCKEASAFTKTIG